MITGDHPGTARRIAADLGIVGPGAPVVTGAELDALRRGRSARAACSAVSVYARVAPQHKLRIVDALQAGGEVVAMTGDGVNDAPALKAADIGIAMGRTGTEVTTEAAEMILADDNFATIVAAVREGRVIFDNIRKFLRYLLSSNLGEVFTVFFGVLLGGAARHRRATGQATVVLPLLATQILWINLVTDSAPALAMGVDPEIDDVMARPPRRPSDRIIDARMWAGIVFVGLVMAAVTLLTMDLFLPGGLIAGDGSLEQARTAGFTTLVLAQLFNRSTRARGWPAPSSPVHQPVAVGVAGARRGAAGRGRGGAVPADRLRNRVADAGAVGDSGAVGVAGAVDRGAAQAGHAAAASVLPKSSRKRAAADQSAIDALTVGVADVAGERAGRGRAQGSFQ